jgi:hypothetical protein
LKYALESPTDRALAFARYQGPRPLCQEDYGKDQMRY